MRTSHNTPAIVLRSHPYGESDKIVSFFTQGFGKLTGIAKGALRSRKRFVNSLEPISLVNLRFQERSHSNLVFILASDLSDGYRRLRSNLEHISHASYLVEITDGLTGERDENTALFEHLKTSLHYLDENGTSLRFLTSFELKLLKFAGYQPVLTCCKRCGEDRFEQSTTRWHFSPADGGILCGACAQARQEIFPLGAAAVEILTALQAESAELSARVSLPFSVVQEVRGALLRFIQYHIAKEIKSAPFLYQFSAN